MTDVFVDTSALYALLAEDDRYHSEASTTFAEMRGGPPLITHNYVVVETVALTQRRLGTGAVRDLIDRLLRPIEVAWIEPEIHQMAVVALISAGRGDVSLVDFTSFELMWRRGITTAFAFDPDFTRQGFTVMPSGG